LCSSGTLVSSSRRSLAVIFRYLRGIWETTSGS
jgi:hypothetical protein